MKDENKEPVVIGTLKEEKQRGPLVVLIIMVILIGVVIFLPDIKNMIEKKDIPSGVAPVKPVTNNNDEEEIEESKINNFTDELVVNYLDLSFSNIRKESNKIIFNIQNNRNKDLILNDEFLYIELYDMTQTLVERIKIYDYKNIISMTTKELSFDTKNDLSNVTLIKIVKIDEEGYPNVSLNENEEKESTLTCVLGNSELTYIFKENKLIKFKELYKYSNVLNLEEYSNELMTYKNKAEALNKIVGVTSIVTESDLNFIFNTEFDMASANISKLENPVYFIKDASSKKIAFEMNAMRFDCK